jgi:hypothetical protein
MISHFHIIVPNLCRQFLQCQIGLKTSAEQLPRAISPRSSASNCSLDGYPYMIEMMSFEPHSGHRTASSFIGRSSMGRSALWLQAVIQ